MNQNDTIVARAYTIPKIIKEPEHEGNSYEQQIMSPALLSVVDDMKGMLDRDLTRTA